jgi:hypothetical protein
MKHQQNPSSNIAQSVAQGHDVDSHSYSVSYIQELMYTQTKKGYHIGFGVVYS